MVSLAKGEACGTADPSPGISEMGTSWGMEELPRSLVELTLKMLLGAARWQYQCPQEGGFGAKDLPIPSQEDTITAEPQQLLGGRALVGEDLRAWCLPPFGIGLLSLSLLGD
ncbi:hypothetical protein Y1Q_0002602 [Alligator mississippiensis]|uniref:Uncharacterized protein n=1 Tax=Alligator mississippiensis TaxID=8496 RepID=A0A151NKQ7_ALLMI|nr:hypothetical protein Y1Q_0002602 [Alligator mississippiensis]